MTAWNFAATMIWAPAWLAGVVFASGFWLTSAAIFFPPYAWYLVAVKILAAAGLA